MTTTGPHQTTRRYLRTPRMARDRRWLALGCIALAQLHTGGPAALVHGYSVAAAWAAGILAFAGLMVAALINAPRLQQRHAQ